MKRCSGLIFTLLAGIFLTGGVVRADSFSIGTAGPSNWGILSIGNGQVSLNGGVAGVTGPGADNVGIGGTGKANFSGTTTIAGHLFLSTTASTSSSISGTTVGGSSCSTPISTNCTQAFVGSSFLTTAISDALTAQTTHFGFANFTSCNAAFGTLCNTTLTTTQTIDLSSQPVGAYELVLTGIGLISNAALTFNAPAGDTILVVDNGNFTLGGCGGLLLSGGIGSSNILFYVPGTSSSVSGSGGCGSGPQLDGILFTNSNVNFSETTVSGEVIGSGDISIVSGSSVHTVATTPEPATLSLFGAGLLMVGGLVRRKMTRQKR